MIAIQPRNWLPTLTVLLQLIKKGVAIDCFDCYSLDGNNKDCEDHFGPHNITGYLIKRECRVGYLEFRAHFCVKIKGVKENGQTIVIRTCSVDNWGTQCGDILFEQGESKEPITGCLSSCPFDGCNMASMNGVHSTRIVIGALCAIIYMRWLHFQRAI